MTRHRHRKRSGDDHVDNAARFKARLRENTEAASLPDTPANRMRITDATYIDLAIDNTRAGILRGEVVEVSALERLVGARNGILPPASEPFVVRFVDHTDICSCAARPCHPRKRPRL
jgi:hypothetical protein